MLNIESILTENKKRNLILDAPYDPYRGVGSPIKRQEVIFSDWDKSIYLPDSMLEVEWVKSFLDKYKSFTDGANKVGLSIEGLMTNFNYERFNHDFEFWAASTIYILDKDTFKDIPFILRSAQRVLLFELEEMRLAGVPIRIVLLKARQWGGSTLVQIYMMWIQQIHRTKWHLAVCAQDDSAARNITAMYSNAADKYPIELGKITLAPYERSKNRISKERGGIIGVGSINNPDQFRSYNYAMGHFSELGVWPDTPMRSVQALITSLKETIPDVPYSFIAEESTARGLNYFYDSWKRAVSNKSRYKAIFIPWWKIDRDRVSITEDLKVYVESMGQYDWTLWELGATLEGINWYNKHKADRYEQEDKKNSMFSEWQMQQENPSTPEEAFQSAGEKRFNPLYVSAMEKDCMPPEFIGEVNADADQGETCLNNIEFIPSQKGKLSIWTYPDNSINVQHRYVAYADIGGVWKGADYSVLKVVDRYWMIEGGDPEVVAVWYGHIDKDLFGWKCAQICKMYNNALLALESNTYDKDRRLDDHFLTVIEKIVDYYPNLYIRNRPEKVGSDFVPIYGFHMNRETKPAVINSLYAASRERYNKDNGVKTGSCLIERDIRAIKEMNWFEKKADGTLGAIEGQHDDHVDATAGVFYIATDKMPMPFVIERQATTNKRIMTSEASF